MRVDIIVRESFIALGWVIALREQGTLSFIVVVHSSCHLTKAEEFATLSEAADALDYSMPQGSDEGCWVQKTASLHQAREILGEEDLQWFQDRFCANLPF